MFGRCSVYVIHSTSGHYKIGHSDQPKRRLKELKKTQGPYEYRLVYHWVFSGKDEAAYVERYLHRTFRSAKTKGEWFNLSFTDLIDLSNVVESARADYQRR